MEIFELVGYVLLYSYVAFGFGYILKKGFSGNITAPREDLIPKIGVYDKTPVKLDYLFEDTDIFQIAP